MFPRRCLFLFLTFLLFANPAWAQPDIRVRVVEPVGFIAPGEFQQVEFEIINPPDSGVSIVSISGGGSSGHRPIVNTSADWAPVGSGAIAPNPIDRQTRMRAIANRSCRGDDCIVEGGFPARPGESVRYLNNSVWAAADAEPGTELGVDAMHLSFRFSGGDGGFDETRYYADSNFVRIVTVDGRGDYSLFAGVDVSSPVAGFMRVALAGEFAYVNEIAAGAGFDLYLTLTNRGSSAVRLPGLGRGSMMGSFREQSGNHARSYRFVPCEAQCGTTAVFPELAPGESTDILLGTYYYENTQFYPGELMLDDLQVRVMDASDRMGTTVVVAEPVRITITNSAATQALYDRSGNRPQPLVQDDLLTDNDRMLIFDPNTGLEWLPVTAGTGLTPEDMLAETGTRGRFNGFVMARAEQVEKLLLNHLQAAGLNIGAYALGSTMSPENADAWQSFIRLFGPIPSTNSGWGVIGIVSDPVVGNPNTGRYTSVEVSAPEPSPDGAFTPFSTGNQYRQATTGLEHHSYDAVGYWMVRER